MIVAGFGFQTGAQVSSLREVLAATGATPDRIATAAAKADHAGLVALATDLGIALIAVTPEMLASQTTLTRSGASLRTHGTGSVAEAAALAAAGRNATLTGPRRISRDRMATCAIAIGEFN